MQVLTDSLAMEWTPAQAAWLKQTEGVESVIDAVKRIQTPQVKGLEINAYSCLICNAICLHTHIRFCPTEPHDSV